ncbi:hypothetical protein [Parvularcula sp. IMCC14364]|uniref:hypothetical protein n=1 Tax=Parvularcula sp. IMCC14364 TaxID=3067902 RepID=UPI00274123A8|nr:hypothetical protein [Parvularcula sp. IMCC14364]
MLKKLALTAAIFISGTGVVIAQSTGTPPPAPCQSAEYRAFDFWLGQWDVYDTSGNLAGSNSITLEEGGCLILEKWTNTQGGTGQSYNFYDPGMGQFRQVWVSSGAVIDYAGQLNEAGEMVLEGDINYHNGTAAPFRGTWTLQEDGSVRQYFQQYDADGEVWNDWFTGIYVKQEEGE